MRWPSSLRLRLLAVYAMGMAFSAMLVGLAILLLMEPFNRHMLNAGAISAAQWMAKRVQFGPDGRPVGIDETMMEQWIFTSLSQEIVVRVTDASGKVYFTPAGEAVALAPDNTPFEPQREGFTFAHGGVSMHGATVPLVHRGVTWYVQFAASDRLILQIRNSVGVPALFKGMIAICLTFFAVFLVTTHLTLQRMLRPVRQASVAAQGITPQTLDARIDVRELPDEISPLVQAFNTALERLQLGFQTQQDFMANAAHELKTPLALMRAQIELDGGGASDSPLIQDVDRMARQVQQLLHLAEASEPRNYKIEALDSRAMLQEVLGYMDRVAEQSGGRIRLVDAQGLALWRADRGALFTLFKNLLENAIQHSPAGGVVTLISNTSGFVVADQGPGVKPGEYAQLFQRFWRGAGRRDVGAGLGLSICQEIARAHGWHIEARPGTSGLQVHVFMVAEQGAGPA